MRVLHFDCFGGTDDIGDAIERADLVKMHLLDGHAMNTGFRDRKAMENFLGQSSLIKSQRSLIDDCLDIGKIAMIFLFGGFDVDSRGQNAVPFDLLHEQSYR